MVQGSHRKGRVGPGPMNVWRQDQDEELKLWGG